MTGPSIVEQYWTGVASQLQVEADVFSRLVEHNGEAGRANELALARLVSQLLPGHLDVGTGVVFDSEGNRSKQADLVVFDRGAQPQILAQSTQLLFPVETVRMVIEVKTTLSSAEIVEVAEKARRLRALRPVDGQSVPAFALFAYQAAVAPPSRAAELNGLSSATRPDIACILHPGIVTDPSAPDLVGLVPLHQVEDGERVSRSWIRFHETGAWTVRGSTRYPVSRFTPNARERYVFEPGRALLLFASSLLDHLATGGSAWLASYLTETAREVVVPGTSVLRGSQAD